MKYTNGFYVGLGFSFCLWEFSSKFIVILCLFGWLEGYHMSLSVTCLMSLENNSPFSKQGYRPQGANNSHPQFKEFLLVFQSIEKMNFSDKLLWFYFSSYLASFYVFHLFLSPWSIISFADTLSPSIVNVFTASPCPSTTFFL